MTHRTDPDRRALLGWNTDLAACSPLGSVVPLIREPA
jgi:hypothetical protein